MTDSKRFLQSLTTLLMVLFLTACSSAEDPLALTSAGNASSASGGQENTPITSPDETQGETTSPATPSTPGETTNPGTESPQTPSGSFQNPTLPGVPTSPDAPTSPGTPSTPGTTPETDNDIDSPSPVPTPAFTIKTPPQSQQVAEGDSVTFQVEIDSRYSASIQWYYNGRVIAGAMGRVYIIPRTTLSHAGNYQVKVTAAKQQLMSPIATLDVAPETASAEGSATITWVRPSQRESGATLDRSDIKTYRIYHTSSKEEEAVYEVAGDKTSFTVDRLTSGHHSFALTTVDSDDRESTLSTVVSKTIL
ncbi:MAG: immunoglobulin domain-containing protein [Hahellaceae bacterium]|nr:immunoglobulin domain-containing protein [Hahellaceae bacterium]